MMANPVPAWQAKQYAKIRDQQRPDYEVELGLDAQTGLPLALLIESTIGLYEDGKTKRLFKISGLAGLFLRVRKHETWQGEVIAVNTDPRASFPSKFRPLTDRECETWMTKVAYQKSLLDAQEARRR